MRAGGNSGAGKALARAWQRSALARRLGCPVDEAADLLEERVSRRRFLAGAGTVAASLAGATALGHGVAGATDHRRARTRGASGPGRVVIVGAGIAGLSCAERLWAQYGVPSTVYEWDTRAGGRIRTLRGAFADDQLVEEHAEFVNPEHTATLHLARRLNLALDNMDHYPSGTHGRDDVYRFGGATWSQAGVDQAWHDWGWRTFHAAAAAVGWPLLYDRGTPDGVAVDHQSVDEWIDANVPGGLASDFGALCVAAVLDEFGGPTGDTSAYNLVTLLGSDASTSSGNQPRGQPALGGADEKWHVRGGTDLLTSGLLDRLPPGTVQLGQRLVALQNAGSGYTCTFTDGATVVDVPADAVVLTLPFTTLRQVDLSGLDLSPLHRTAIDQEPLGDNAKFFVQCATRVWDRPDHLDGNAYDDGPVQGSWDASLHQAGPAGILAALPGGETGLSWGARYGLTTYRGTPPPAMVAVHLADFEQLFPGVTAAYNGKAFYVWSSGDPHILGAYSYLQVGQFTQFNGIQGVAEGGVHFGGEHTSINFQGYIEGGLRSGLRCADEVMGVRTRWPLLRS